VLKGTTPLSRDVSLENSKTDYSTGVTLDNNRPKHSFLTLLFKFLLLSSLKTPKKPRRKWLGEWAV
jgi:hypothetical protein